MIPWLYGRGARFLLKQKAIRKKVVILTFDDGPGSKLTPWILQILKEHNAKATFFLLGENIQGRAGIVKQIEQQGHEICSHSYEHLHYWKVSPFAAISDIRKGWEAIDEALGRTKSKYPFRPPGGKLNIISLIYLLVNRVPIYYWTIASGDTFPQKERDLNHTASLLKFLGGGVVLAHDFDRTDKNSDEFVIDSLKKTLACIKKQKLKTATLSEFLNVLS